MQLIRRPSSGRGTRALAGNESGLAVIEFALVLPFLITIGMAGTEVANLAVTTLRVNQLAMLAADNAARVRSSMDEQDVNEVMVGLRFAGTGIKFGERGRVIISDLEANGQTGTKAGYKITWQRCFGSKNASSTVGTELAGSNDASLQGLKIGATTSNLTPVTSSAVIVAEINYTYKPVVASMFMNETTLTAKQAFPVRERAQQGLTNTTKMSDAAIRKCDAAHLSAT